MNQLLNAFLIDENTSVSDLESSLSIIQKEIEKRKEQELDEARLKLRDYAKSLGVPLEKLMEEPKGKKKVEPKYRSKLDPSKSWTGRGKQPHWLVEELKQSGGSLKDYLI